MAQVKSVKPKNSWVDKDLTKRPKKKCFEENGVLSNVKKHRTTKNWVEEELSKFPIIKKIKKKKRRKKDTKKTVKMSRLCKAGLFFLR